MQETLAQPPAGVDTGMRAQWRGSLITNQAPVAVHSLNREGIIVSVSDRWLEMLGYRRDEVIGAPIFRFQTEETARRVRENWPRFLATGDVRDLELQFVRKTGEVIDVLLSAR